VLRRAGKWLISCLGVVVCVAALAILATAHRGDPALWPPRDGEPRADIFVVSNGYHSGVVLPRAALAAAAGRQGAGAALEVASRFAAYPWIEIGWGDEEFYRSVPTAASVTARLAFRALFESNASVVHVVGLVAHPRTMFPNAEIVRVGVSADGFDRVLGMLDRTLARGPDGHLATDLGPGLYGPSLFFRAVGGFGIFNVCNHWVARLLDAAGLPTDGALATLPRGLILDLRWRAGLTPLPVDPPSAPT
jgi:uncharacterized protein (TIGR02117 family)